MARIVTQDDLMDLDALRASGVDIKHVYCGLDGCVTLEVLNLLKHRLTPELDTIYGFQMACQAPTFVMQLRGVRVDEAKKQEMIGVLTKEMEQCAADLDATPMMQRWWTAVKNDTGPCPKSERKDGKHSWPRSTPHTPTSDSKGLPSPTAPICCKTCGGPRSVRSPFNPGSDDQAFQLFYRNMKLPEQRNKDGDPAVDEECLNRIAKRTPKVAPIVETILAYRGLAKRRGVLMSAQSPDGRMRTTISVGATETGRYSSTKNPYGDGTNMQNIGNKLRCVFIPDTGWEFFYADLEQSESRDVAYLWEVPEYIEAHIRGDVHTYVCRLVWPELPWTGDLKADRKIAEENFPDWDPDHDYRFNSKRTQHGGNYGLTPRGLAILAHISIAAASECQGRYFAAFPGIRAGQQRTAAILRQSMTLTSPFGRRRQFMGRLWGRGPLDLDEHVYKEGLAFIPQSMTADKLNIGMWRVWDELDRKRDRVRLLLQIHDAILGQRRIGDDAVLCAVEDLMTIPVDVHGRMMVTPVDIQVGMNFGKFNNNPKKGPVNLAGLKKWHRPKSFPPCLGNGQALRSGLLAA